MKNEKKIAIFIIGFILAGSLVTLFFPKERKKNPEATIRIGAGDDMSGILMEQITEELEGKYKVADTLESSSFQDC